MKLLSALRPDLAPLAIAHIKASVDASTSCCAFRGFCYYVDSVSGVVWHCCADWSDAVPFVNEWRDVDFGLPEQVRAE